MSLHRTKAAIIGLLEANRVNEWVVTEKLGNAMKQKNNNARPSRNSRFRFTERYLKILQQICLIVFYSTHNCDNKVKLPLNPFL